MQGGRNVIPPRTREVSVILNVDACSGGRDQYSRWLHRGETDARRPVGATTATEEGTLAGFLVLAFGFGLAAIFTPCVFPMIPGEHVLFRGATRRFPAAGQRSVSASSFCSADLA